MARSGEPTPPGAGGWLRGAARLGSQDEPEFGWLLAALVAQLTALTLVRSELLTELVMSVSLVAVGLATIPLLPASGVARRLQFVLCGVSVVFVWMSPQSGGTVLYTVGRSAVVLFVVTVAMWTVWHLSRARRVTARTLLGAVSGYLLLGIAFGSLFAIAERTVPGSLQSSVAGTDLEEIGHLLYYSFVTLTTVGYGDVTPVGDGARLLAILESVLGQFYIAAVVARLISLHVSPAGQDSTPS